MVVYPRYLNMVNYKCLLSPAVRENGYEKTATITCEQLSRVHGQLLEPGGAGVDAKGTERLLRHVGG